MGGVWSTQVEVHFVLASMAWVVSTHVEMHLMPSLAWDRFGEH